MLVKLPLSHNRILVHPRLPHVVALASRTKELEWVLMVLMMSVQGIILRWPVYDIPALMRTGVVAYVVSSLILTKLVKPAYNAVVTSMAIPVPSQKMAEGTCVQIGSKIPRLDADGSRRKARGR